MQDAPSLDPTTAQVTPGEEGGLTVDVRVPTYEGMATFTLMVERDADGDWRLFLPDASGFEESRGIVYLGAPDQPVVAARLKPDGGPRLNVLQALTVEDFRLAAQIVSEDQQFCEQTERDPRDLDRIASVLAEAGRDHPARYVDPLSKGEAGADV